MGNLIYKIIYPLKIVTVTSSLNSMYRQSLRSKADATNQDRVCTRSLEPLDNPNKAFIPSGKLTPFRMKKPEEPTYNVISVSKNDSATQFIERMKSHIVTGRSNEPALAAFVKSYCNLRKNKETDVRGTSDRLINSAHYYKKCASDAKRITCTMAR